MLNDFKPIYQLFGPIYLSTMGLIQNVGVDGYIGSVRQGQTPIPVSAQFCTTMIVLSDMAILYMWLCDIHAV